ncbi:GyrI-like domain-containing protein [Dietzia maris]|uniref:GyrI-like domain-containing protein n=1 Tax=Dietzia maris TaxID=37915 RepID=UPI00223B19ED|nr:GyrI-like domain-containing protein [Dietzia maris]MCT1432398.1 GyrI-like domain-containing protein [Dietzia maris]MCT1519662.1 GyrI-like domain-containing protein [Dietzia maris]
MVGDPPNYDIKRARRDLYSGKAGRVDLVEVPPMDFLMVDGRGDPNTAPEYGAAVEALYATSYAVRAAARTVLGRVHTVGPLEGLWYADDPQVFTARDKAAWSWTMMIWQPDWVTPDILSAAMEKVTTTTVPDARERVRFDGYAEGSAVQTLHVGPYDDEGPIIARMHEEIIPSHGATPSGHHHEIYLSDPRRSDPARLKTILRQPITIG